MRKVATAFVVICLLFIVVLVLTGGPEFGTTMTGVESTPVIVVPNSSMAPTPPVAAPTPPVAAPTPPVAAPTPSVTPRPTPALGATTQAPPGTDQNWLFVAFVLIFVVGGVVVVVLNLKHK